MVSSSDEYKYSINAIIVFVIALGGIIALIGYMVSVSNDTFGTVMIFIGSVIMIIAGLFLFIRSTQGLLVE
jgi:sulfite exporter TauE/SafE